MFYGKYHAEHSDLIYGNKKLKGTAYDGQLHYRRYADMRLNFCRISYLESAHVIIHFFEGISQQDIQ